MLFLKVRSSTFFASFIFFVSACTFSFAPPSANAQAFKGIETSSQRICNQILVHAEIEADQKILLNTILKLFMVDYPIFFQPRISRSFIYSFSKSLNGIYSFSEQLWWDHFFLLSQKITPFKNEYKPKLQAAATSSWDHLVKRTKESTPLQLMEYYTLFSSEELKTIRQTLLTFDQHPKLKALAIQAIIEFFFLSDHFSGLLASYGNVDDDWGFTSLTLYKGKKYLSPQKFIRSQIAKPNELIFANRPTLLDIPTLKDEEITSILLEAVDEKPLDFQGIKEKVKKIESENSLPPSEETILNQTHQMREISHYLNYLLQTEYEKFSSHSFWPLYRNALEAWLANPDALLTKFRHPFLRLNFQAIVMSSQKLNDFYQARTVIQLVQGSFKQQLQYLEKLHSEENDLTRDPLSKEVLEKSITSLSAMITHLENYSTKTNQLMSNIDTLLNTFQDVETLMREGKDASHIKNFLATERVKTLRELNLPLLPEPALAPAASKSDHSLPFFWKKKSI